MLLKYDGSKSVKHGFVFPDVVLKFIVRGHREPLRVLSMTHGVPGLSELGWGKCLPSAVQPKKTVVITYYGLNAISPQNSHLET